MDAIHRLMEKETAGDPISGVKWTRKTTEKIAAQLRLTVVPASESEPREIVVTVPHRKGSIARPPIVVPKSISHSMAGPGIGLLKVLFFPGLFGMRFSRALAKSMEVLNRQRLDRLIIDLRGNIGGSMGLRI